MVDKQKQVLIVGGGFAGWWAAKRLSRVKNSAVTLVDSSDHITMLPALPDVASGKIAPDYLSEPIKSLLPGNVAFTNDRIEHIDLDTRSATGSSEKYQFDFLILAAGSQTNFYGFDAGGVPIHTLTSLADAVNVRDELARYLATTKNPHAVVVGAGYTGLELAVALRNRADALGRQLPITVLEKAPVLLPFLPENERDYISSYLSGVNIAVHLGKTVASVDQESLVLDDGTEVTTPFLCWAAGAKRSLDSISPGISTTPDGRVVVDPSLEVPGYPGVFVAGDAAAIEANGTILRRAINFSLFSGRHAADGVIRRLAGENPRPFKPVDLGWVIPLDRISVGRLFGKLGVRGKLGMRLHYFMNGYRNFSPRNFFAFARLAIKLPTSKRLAEDP